MVPSLCEKYSQTYRKLHNGDLTDQEKSVLNENNCTLFPQRPQGELHTIDTTQEEKDEYWQRVSCLTTPTLKYPYTQAWQQFNSAENPIEQLSALEELMDVSELDTAKKLAEKWTNYQTLFNLVKSSRREDKKRFVEVFEEARRSLASEPGVHEQHVSPEYIRHNNN
jgi:hypothetical protein